MEPKAPTAASSCCLWYRPQIYRPEREGATTMTDLTFVHLSDLHILSSAEEQFREVRTAEKLHQVFALIRNMEIKPDFFVLSGDLVNDGHRAEYETLNGLLDELRAFGAPLIIGLGNHDCRAHFRQIVLGQEPGDEAERYYHSAVLGGLRVIMLDSKVPGLVQGELDSPQLAWLETELRKPAPLGVLIAVHHPPVYSTIEPLNEHRLLNPQDLADVIAGHNVHAVLSGHIHYAHIAAFAGTLSITTPATAFSLDPGITREVSPTDGWGFALCTLHNGQLYVNPILKYSQTPLP